jgi:hypothetical protein
LNKLYINPHFTAVPVARCPSSSRLSSNMHAPASTQPLSPREQLPSSPHQHPCGTSEVTTPAAGQRTTTATTLMHAPASSHQPYQQQQQPQQQHIAVPQSPAKRPRPSEESNAVVPAHHHHHHVPPPAPAPAASHPFQKLGANLSKALKSVCKVFSTIARWEPPFCNSRSQLADRPYAAYTPPVIL